MPRRLVVLFERFLLEFNMLSKEVKQDLPHQYLYLLRDSWLDSVPVLRAAPELPSDSDSNSSVENKC